MLGIGLAFLSAILVSAKTIEVKKFFEESDEYWGGCLMTMCSWPLALAILMFYNFPSVTKIFWYLLAFKGILASVVIVLFIKAHKYDVSLITPMMCFTPVFMLPLSPLVLGQNISLTGVICVILIVIGAYLLNVSDIKSGLLAPIKSLVNNRGARIMLLVAFLNAIMSIIDGLGIKNAGNDFLGSIYWTFITNLVTSMLLLFIILIGRKKNSDLTQTKKKQILCAGFFRGLEEITQMCAMTFIPAVYVNAIKRTSVIIVVAIGGSLFKEKKLKQRIPGAIVMVIGVVLLLFSSI